MNALGLRQLQRTDSTGHRGLVLCFEGVNLQQEPSNIASGQATRSGALGAFVEIS